MVLKRMGAALAVTAAALALTANCNLNQSGRLGATKTGDITNPAERGSPVTGLQQACGADGAPAPDAMTTLGREPYLQRVTSSSAMIGWRSAAPAAQHVVVTAPDGTAVATAAGTVDPARARGGKLQAWAQVEGLTPDTTYCYVLANGELPLTSRIGFRTAPAADSTRTIRFMAFGDSGDGGSDQYTLLQHMNDVPFEMMIHVGDLAYDKGAHADIDTQVFEPYAELLRHIPFFPVAGNHDYETDNGAPFREVFALPPGGGEKWFSYDWGRIHFAAVDTEQDYATQVAWLDEDLASSKLPWKIVYLHHPLYSSGEHGSDLPLRKLLEPVLEKHGVQLVFAGHDHHYERILPQKGIAHIVTGGGGRGVRTAGSSAFTALVDEVIHFVYAEVGVDEMVLHAIDGTGAEFDSLVIPRTRAAN